MIRPDRDAAPPPVLCNHGLRHSGGIERYLTTLVQELHRRGIRPTVVAKRFDTTLAEYGWVDAVPVSMFGVPGPLRDFWFDRRLRALKRERHWFPLVALNQTAAADIAVCGSTHPGHLASLGRTAGWLDRRKIALERRHLHNARVVVAHSRLLAAQVQRYHGVAPEKIVVLHPPVDVQRFHPVDAARRAELRRRLGLPADRAVFLLASTGHARKGLDLALRALSEGFRLVADDRVVLWRSGGRLFGRAPDPLKGVMELRGLDVVATPAVAMAEVALVARSGDPQRIPEVQHVDLLGTTLPLIELDLGAHSGPAKLSRALDLFDGNHKRRI